jgi:hypothetical protein
MKFTDQRGVHPIAIIIAVVLILAIAAGMGWYLAQRAQDNAPIPVETIQDDTVPTPPPPSVLEDPQYAQDSDHDGVSDEDEAAYGTSDTSIDTDQDGLLDRKEIMVWGTDPTNPDTDGDGYLDGVEVMQGYNPNGEGTLP